MFYSTYPDYGPVTEKCIAIWFSDAVANDECDDFERVGNQDDLYEMVYRLNDTGTVTIIERA